MYGKEVSKTMNEYEKFHDFNGKKFRTTLHLFYSINQMIKEERDFLFSSKDPKIIHGVFEKVIQKRYDKSRTEFENILLEKSDWMNSVFTANYDILKKMFYETRISFGEFKKDYNAALNLFNQLKIDYGIKYGEFLNSGFESQIESLSDIFFPDLVELENSKINLEELLIPYEFSLRMLKSTNYTVSQMKLAHEGLNFYYNRINFFLDTELDVLSIHDIIQRDELEDCISELGLNDKKMKSNYKSLSTLN